MTQNSEHYPSVGTLDTQVQLKPIAHIFVGSKAPWDEIHDDIPQYAERP